MCDILHSNLLSIAVLAFFLGLAAVLFKSDLKLPEGLYAGLSVYLLLSLGLKGGNALCKFGLNSFLGPLLLTLLLSITIPFVSFFLARAFRFSRIDSAALSAHYGSVSVVTFMTTQLFLDSLNIFYDKQTIALVAIMEIPGLVIGLMLANKAKISISWLSEIKEILLGKSIFLLLGGIIMGLLVGPKGFEKVSPFFVDPFQGILVLFMLDMGVVAGNRIMEEKRIPLRLFLMGILMPILSGLLTILIAPLFTKSIGTTTLLAAMAASASYIAAPAAVRLALPKANPAYYLTAAIVITFPFNLSIGIPLYYNLALWYHKFMGF